MNQLKVPVLLLTLLVLLRCATTAPSHRYLNLRSSGQQEIDLPDSEGWLAPGISSNPFLGLIGSRPERGLAAMNSHHLEKRKCNTATCVTQRLADFLVRSSNTIGTVYAPTNVGATAYGKRDLLRHPNYLPL